ncbi:MAG TPA: zinc dependent phospholipase C family protein [Candidatus Angelobacter sp.]|nr:zinc dependent phospholipase C family protein [Candidatus Angelobacter sp.]
MPALCRGERFRTASVSLLVFFLLLTTTPLPAYSVLTHEQIVDFLWHSDIAKLLRERYPDITPEQLREAHAYAYGGSLIQDMGYYPGGNKFFSDLVHYVRSGDFVLEMVRQAHSADELAFALGALSHYVADTNGHPTVNRSVPREFPKLRRKFGNVITYSDDPASHIQTEFGFDVLEVAKQRYTSQAYHDFIGFQVAQPLLDRAFLATYGLQLKSVLKDEDRAIGSYRHAISVWFPRFTQAALITKKDELQAIPNFDAKAFRYTLSRAEYQKEWGNNYYHPGFWAKVIAVIVKILPKVGPLRVIDPKPPIPETEKMYLASVQKTVAVYHKALIMTEQHDLSVPNDDLDTGKRTRPGEYRLADRAYARLVKELARADFANAPPELRQNILSFYSDLNQPFETRRHKSEWAHLVEDLNQLKLVQQSNSQKAISTVIAPN